MTGSGTIRCDSCGRELEGVELLDPGEGPLLCQQCDFALRQMDRVQKSRKGAREAS
jgi:hypothetical protein